jgi:hypothetical protein
LWLWRFPHRDKEKEEAMLVMFLLAVLGAPIPLGNINKICASAQVDTLPG